MQIEASKAMFARPWEWGGTSTMLNYVWDRPQMTSPTYGEGGICQKVTLLHKAYLVKWVTRRREGSKISKNGCRRLWTASIGTTKSTRYVPLNRPITTM